MVGVDGGSDVISATYDLLGTAEEAAATAQRICVEQTVEFPLDLIDREDIKDRIVAKVVSLEALDPGRHRVVVAFPRLVVGSDLTQLLNVLYGNISLVPGIRLVALDLPQPLLAHFDGPRFGRSGLRALAGVERRPLVATALKPMGLSSRELAELAGQLARGGLDIIKDDHGLTDQSFCPFEERVTQCAAAVAEVNARQGTRCLYFANVTAPSGVMAERAAIARRVGAAGLVVAPGLTGLDAMARLAADGDVGLPILSHPAFQGALTVSDDFGIAHGVLYGQLNRLAGADGVIFPSHGGRFSFTRAQCREIVDGATCAMGSFAPIFPAPAGGMSLDRVGELVEFYGDEVVLLIGGDLHRHGAGLIDGCRRFLEAVYSAGVEG